MSSAIEPSFVEVKAPGCELYAAFIGRMFWLTRNKLPGSYLTASSYLEACSTGRWKVGGWHTLRYVCPNHGYLGGYS